MKEIQAHTVEKQTDREQPESDPKRSEIRLLDDYELVLAGGGEGEADWP
jgi:hypothetical protein